MVSAIIVAAGKGTRMGPNTDKLFLELNGCPLVAHTWRRFDRAACVDELVLVVRDGMQSTFAEVAQQYQFKKKFRLVAGGKERQDSVWNGLEAVSPGTEIVAIQDAARPCTTSELIAATVDGARETGAAVAAQAVTDTIKESGDGRVIERTLDRSRLWSVQTPQTFRLDVIRRALAEVRNRKLLLTDDTAACELIGQPVRLVVRAQPNPKITRPEDVAWVEAVLRHEECSVSLCHPSDSTPQVELRNPKLEGRNKFKGRKPAMLKKRLALRVLNVFSSDFGFRI